MFRRRDPCVLSIRALCPLVFIVAASPLSSVNARAGTSDSPVIALHASRTVAKGDLCWNSPPDAVPCEDFTVDEVTHHGFHVYLVAAKADSATGIGGLSCGLSIQGPLYATWRLCADNELQYGSWPEDGGGNRIDWIQCNRSVFFEEDGAQATAGYFYLYTYGPSSIGVVPNVAGGDSQLVVVDCSQNDLVVKLDGGIVGFGTPGFNPCLDIVSTERITWGRLKTTYDKGND
jgi:hypothetical protein